MIIIRHFIPILPPAPGRQDIRRITVDQHIFMVKRPDEFQRRPVLDLDTLEPPAYVLQCLRQTIPVPDRISGLPAIDILFPSALFC